MHLVNKKFKYGYSLDDGTSTIVSPPNLKKIVLTQQNPKFLFYGTRTEILEWMEKNKDIVIEYESDNLSISSSTLSKSTTLLPTVTSSPPTPPVSDSNKDNNFFVNSPTRTTISPESTFLQNYKIIDDDNAITFNLYGIISDELVSCKPLNFAINYLTCFDVLLEIFPTNLLNKDYKKYLPIKTTILPSGMDLQSISRELEKSWKQASLSNNCDNLLSKKCIPIKKTKSANRFKDEEGDGEKRRNSFSELVKEKLEMFEVEEDINNYCHKPFSLRQYGSSNNLLDWISTKSPPTFYSLKNREASASSKSTPIPPGILTPYIMDDMINQMEDNPRFISKVEEAINENNNHNNYHSEAVNLPLYEHSHDDLLLERGSSMKRNNLL